MGFEFRALFVFILCILCLFSQATAQNSDSVKTPRFTRSVKFSAYYYRYRDDIIDPGFNTFRINRRGRNMYSSTSIPMVALVWKNNKRFNAHELEFQNLNILTRKYEYPGNATKNFSEELSFTLRYQYSFFFVKKARPLFSPYLGIYMLENVSDIYGHHSRKYTEAVFNTHLGIVPGLQIRISRRLSADLSLPLNCLKDEFVYYRDSRGSLHQSRINFLPFIFTDYLTARIGLNVQLSTGEKETNVKKYIKGFKLNHNIELSNSSFSGIISKRINSSGLFPVFTLRNRASGDMHELEIYNPYFYTHFNSRPNIQEKNIYGRMGFRYQYDYFFIKKGNPVMSPYLGLFALASVFRNKTVSNNLITEAWYSKGYLFSTGLTPGVQVWLTSRIYSDFSIPFTLFTSSGGIYEKTISNLISPSFQYYSTTHEKFKQNSFIKTLTPVTFRVGLGFFI